MHQARVLRLPGGPTFRYGIDCPYCWESLDYAITVAALREQRGVGPGDTLYGECGDTFRLPRHFPVALAD